MRVRRAGRGAMGACLALSAAAATYAHAEAPKNVILFVGDGMGAEQVKAAGYYFNGASGLFNFEQFTHSAWMTHNNLAGTVTDSAASATAMATGTKVNDGVISVDGSGNPLTTLLEMFHDAGKRTGLVTTSYMTDATPAAFGAHNVSRANSADIAGDYFDAQHKPNVLFGSTRTGFDAAAAASAGYTVASNRAQLQAINTASTTFAAGVFPADVATGGFGYAYDNPGYYASNPFLHEMTQTALDILDNDADGFFLLVENELTDASGHQAVGSANKVERNIHEVGQLALAVQKAIDFAATHPDTLILVTADHETGAFTANQNNGQLVLPTVVSGSNQHQATWVPVWAMGPNAGHVTGHIDNTDIPGIVLSGAPEPVLATRKTFQQGANGYTGAHDTHVRGSAANTAFGATPLLVVDGADAGAPSQAVIRFDDLFGPLAIPADGVEIRSARLALHTGNATDDQTNNTLAIHRLLVAFTEATTWNTAGSPSNGGFSLNGAGTADDDYLAAAESTFVSPDMNALVTFDVTATLQAWLDDPASNFGWLILSNGTDGWRWDSSEGAVAALRPLLEVTYAPVPEPSSLVLLAVVPALLTRRRRR